MYADNSKDRVLVYGLTTNQIDGTCSFLLNMQKYMSGKVIFDHVIEGNHTIYDKIIKSRDGIVHFISPKRKMFRNALDWVRLLKKNRRRYKKIYFNMYNMAWIVPVIISKFYGYEVIIHAHNNKLHNCSILQRMMHNINRLFQARLKITRLSNSDLSARFFYCNSKATIIKCAIEVNKFAFNRTVRFILRDELNLENNNVYGFVGRIAYQKNPLFLMDIFKEIRNMDNKAAFIVCGNGNMLDETKKRAENNGIEVLFLGDRRDVEKYYQAMDAFVLPSQFEGLGIVLIEAQTSGLPSITSSVVVPKDTKVTDLLEYVSLSEDAKVWAKKITSMLMQNHSDRSIYSDIIRDTDYNIVKEALRLEQILIS